MLECFEHLLYELESIMTHNIFACKQQRKSESVVRKKKRKGTDQPGHLHSLISTFVICFLVK